MKTSTASIEVNILQKVLLATFACGALAVLSPRAHAADLALPDDTPQITISTPKVKVVGHRGDLSPVEQTTVTANVWFDPVTLTTNSGVALLKDKVLEAARRVCRDADPQDLEDDDACVRKAVKGTDPQVDSAIARAKKSSVGT